MALVTEDKAHILEEELETYEREKDRLVDAHLGMYVLIYGGDVAGIFEHEPEAIAEGYKRWGNVPFLVKKVLDYEAAEIFVSNQIDESGLA